MIHDGQITTYKNIATIRAKLGLVADNDLRLADSRSPLPHFHASADVIGLSASLASTSASIVAIQNAITAFTDLDNILTSRDGRVLINSNGNVLHR